MKSTRMIIGMALTLTLFTMSLTSHADQWVGNGSPTGTWEDGAAYVKEVRWKNNGSVSALRVKLMGSVANWEGCYYLDVSVGTNNNTQDDLRAYEAIALTALTTGMPIYAYKLSASATDACEVTQFFISHQ